MRLERIYHIEIYVIEYLKQNLPRVSVSRGRLLGKRWKLRQGIRTGFEPRTRWLCT